ncbi:MAG: methyl-accepting chemotaxis protein [bacterium]|jgi:methyl-accepting chemotaxis protein
MNSIQKKISLLLSASLFFSILFGGIISITISKNALYEQAKERLVSKRETKKVQIQELFKTIKNQTITLSESHMTIQAMQEFKKSFYQFRKDNQIGSEQLNVLKTSLTQYYQNDFQKQFVKKNGSQFKQVEQVIKKLDNDALALQAHYLSKNTHPLGSKDLLETAGDNSKYSQFHKKYHSVFRSFVKKFGYYDLFLADSETGKIVYSVYKEIDFGTSLKNGIYANTGIGKVFQRANQSNTKSTQFIDFKPYLPSYQDAASFIAIPIFDQGKKIGVLIFQMPIDAINNTMTSHKKWKLTGHGKTGETYLIGQDQTMRNYSRFLIEDPKSYFQEVRRKLPLDIAKQIQFKQSSILLHKIDTATSRKALQKQSGVQFVRDYRGVEVLSAYSPIQILGVQWAILSEIDESEIYEKVASLRNWIALFGIVALVALVLVANKFVTILIKPILDIVEMLKTIAEGSVDLTQRIEAKNKDEIGLLARWFNQFIENIQVVVQEVISNASSLATSSDQLATSAIQIGLLSNQLAEGLEDESTTLTQITDTIQKVADSNQQNTHYFVDIKKVTTDAEQEARQGGQAVNRTSDSMKKIEESSRKIEGIINVITDIANQTNLLSLNAAIEAAKAGEFGKGFSVVADEVRNLAERSNTSVNEIQYLIESSVVDVNHGNQVILETKDTLESIINKVHQVSDSMGNISETVQQQNNQFQEVSLSLNDISENSCEHSTSTSELAKIVQEVAVMAEELNSTANQLNAQVNHLKV